MATKKDLVEAYAFSRRRLVTAFVSGAPGGREVEPNRPGRTIIGGIALAILMIAGAAVAGVLKPRTDENWLQGGLVSEKETGADYVILDTPEGEDPVLRQVINITSARLLLGPDIEPTVVPRADIEKQKRTEAIGILQAPSTPPEVDSLIESGWTACTGQDVDDGTLYGIKVDVSDESAVTRIPDVGMLVRSGGTLYVVAETMERGQEQPRAYSYEVPDTGRADALLTDLGLPGSSTAVKVQREWLDLVPAGSPLTLDTFGLGDAIGDRSLFAGTEGLPDAARVGDFVQDDAKTFIVTDDGLAELSEFAAAVYSNAEFPRGFQPEELRTDGQLGLSRPVPAAEGSSWPLGGLSPTTSEEYCLELSAAEGADPAARLATTTAGSPASSVAVPPKDTEVTVDTGHGAVVMAADWDTEGPSERKLIDDQHIAYPVVGDDARDNLGYGSVAEVIVPDAWVQLFDPGVSLSVADARCPAAATARGSSCE